MTLLCRPRGRGNWRLITITVSWAADLFAVQRGHKFELGGRSLRVVEVLP